MSNEPIRLPAVVVALLLVVGPPVAAVLNGADPKQAIATAILGLVAAGGVIGRAESIRARTDSPATIQAKWDAHATDVASDLADRAEPTSNVIGTATLNLSTPAGEDERPLTLADVGDRLAELAEQLRA